MKKITIVIISIIVLSITGYSKVNFFIDLTGSFLKPADTGYADIYGEQIFYPELISGIKVFKDIYLYAGYGFLNLNGEIADAGGDVSASSKQSFISFGIGYEFMSEKRISIKLSGGFVFVNYEGKAYLSDTLIDDNIGNKTGYKFDIGIFYNLNKNFNISFLAGYFHAQNTEDYYRKLSYGGLKAGAGLGISF